MRFYLNNVLIEEPEGLSGMYLQKLRSSRTFGMNRVNIGRVRNAGKMRGLGEIKFVQDIAIRILESAFKKNKIDAEVNFKMVDLLGMVLVDAEINFSNFRKSRSGFSVTLRDEGDLESLDFLSDTEVSIQANETITLSAINLAQSKTHSILEELMKYVHKVPINKSLRSFVPWKAESSKADATGSPQSVGSFVEEQAFWVNSTGDAKRIRVTGKISLKHYSVTTTSGYLMIYCISGNTKTDYIVCPVVIGAVATVDYVIDKIISVPQNGQLYMVFSEFNNQSQDFYFQYSTISYLCVNQDEAYSDSTVKAIEATDALQQIANVIAPKITIENKSNYVLPYIFNGGLLRQVEGYLMNLSFQSLWEDLNKMYCLMLNPIDRNTLQIKDRNDFVSSLGDGVIMKDVQDYELSPSLDFYFNKVRVGFQKWQSNTPTGQEEVFGNETFLTGLKKTDAILDLECRNTCASEKLIEVIRRKQFETGGNRSDKDDDNDNQIFVYKSSKDFLTNEVLNRWKNYWIVSSNMLSKSSGSPNQSKRVVATEGSSLFTGEYMLLQGVLTSKEWMQLLDVVTFYDKGKKYRVLVKNASYRPGVAGSGAEANTIIEGWVLR